MEIRLRTPSSRNQWILLFLGIAVAAAGAIPVAQGVLSLGWPKTDGVITYSGDKPGFGTVGVDVRYQYTVGGREYAGDRYRFQSILDRTSMESRDVQSVVGRYPAGERVRVAVNPRDPADSVLEPGLDFESLLPLGLGLLLLLVGLGEVRKSDGSTENAPYPLPASPRYRTAMILAVIGAALALYGATDIYQGLISMSWPSVDGRIMYSHARTEANYETLLWYEYYVDNQRYLGSKYRTGGNSTPFRNVAEEAAKRYPVGRTVKVHYSPRDPKEALLEPGVWYGNLVFPIIGAIVLGAAWLAKKYAEVIAARGR